MRRSALATALAVGTLAVCVPSTLRASPLFELAGGVTGTSGFNARTTGPGAPSTYFNPALLTRAPRALELGVLVLSDQISMTLDGRPGGDVPLAVGDRDIRNPDGTPISNDTVPTEWLERGCLPGRGVGACEEPPRFSARPRQAAGSSGETRVYQILGLVTHLIEERLVLGFYALIPYGEFTTANAFYNDEREQFFSNSLHPELYSDRLTATSLSFGAGVGILDNLSAGVSFTLSLKNNAVAKTYVRDPVDYEKLLLTTDVGVRTAVAPHFGLSWTPIERWQLAATAHSEQRFEIETAFGAVLPDGTQSGTTITAIHDFVPWSFALGSELSIIEGGVHGLGIVGTVKYARWSDYLDRHGQSPGRDGPAFAWSDTLSGTVGLRHTYQELQTFLDVTYEPSPAPPQVGRANYVDNDRIAASLGAAYDIDLFDLRFRLSAQLQGHHLLERYQRKLNHLLRDELPDGALDGNNEPVTGARGLQTNNPGWPGFASEGFVYGGSAAVSLLF